MARKSSSALAATARQYEHGVRGASGDAVEDAQGRQDAQMTTGVAWATLPTSSSFCMMRLMRAWRAGDERVRVRVRRRQEEVAAGCARGGQWADMKNKGCGERWGRGDITQGRTTGNLVVLFLFFMLGRACGVDWMQQAETLWLGAGEGIL